MRCRHYVINDVLLLLMLLLLIGTADNRSLLTAHPGKHSPISIELSYRMQ